MTRGLDFLIPENGSPEQALAVVELIDDLRERIYILQHLLLFPSSYTTWSSIQ
jgi:hypothetical protein